MQTNHNTLEATGGQSSLDYDLLNRSSQEAIFEIYQQLQDSGNSGLLEKYENMVTKVIRDVNSFGKEKMELEQMLRSEKHKYNAYLENLENDVEMQIKDVEQNVKKELNDKHQRELDTLRKQMEARMAELHDSMSKFNEDSARVHTTSTSAIRRGSVTTTELANMKSQVTELADQSTMLRSELAAAQTLLAEYRHQVQDLVAVHQLPDRKLALEINNNISGYWASRAHLSQITDVPEENSPTTSRHSSRQSSKNFANSSNDISQVAHSAVSPCGGGDDSGVGGASWTATPTNTLDNSDCRGVLRQKRIDSADENDNLAAVLARDGYITEASGEFGSSNNNNALGSADVNNNGEITPPEFTDPSNLPEHVQFKMERFQQSLDSFVPEEANMNNSNGNDFVERYSHRPFALASYSNAAVPAAKKLSSNVASRYMPSYGTNSSSLRKATMSKYVPDISVPHTSRLGVSTAGGFRGSSYNYARSRSMSSASNNPEHQQQQQQQVSLQSTTADRATASPFGAEMVRQSSILTENTVFADNSDSAAYSNRNNLLYAGGADFRTKVPTDMRQSDMLTPSGHHLVSTVAIEPERVFRVILAGDSAVGKSSILMRLVEDRFVNNLPTTLGVDFFTRLFQTDDDERRTVALQLWDTAGQERFRSLARSYFRRADGVLLVYDVTSEKTFLSIRDWVSVVRESTTDDVSVMICANKADLRNFFSKRNMRTVRTEDGQQLAEAYNTLFIETSAKTGAGVIDGITELIRAMRTREDVSLRTAGLRLDEHSENRTFRCNPIGASASVKRSACS